MTNSVLIGTKNGIFKTQDYRRSPDGRWNEKLVLEVQTTFEEYIAPTPSPEIVVIPADIPTHVDIPVIAEPAPVARRVRLNPGDFLTHGYSAGCHGCIALQRGGEISRSRNHSDSCRACIEAALEMSAEGRMRKQKAEYRKEEQLTR